MNKIDFKSQLHYKPSGHEINLELSFIY